MSTFSLSVGGYAISVSVGTVPLAYGAWKEHATVTEEFGLDSSSASQASGTILVVSVGSTTDEWPFLVVALRFHPGPEAGFNPGLVVVPDEQSLFLGAGETVLIYDLMEPRRLSLDSADTGFLGWRQFEDVVVMSAELELAAWDTKANKLWSTFVEPPWSYEVRSGRVELDVMGRKSSFPLRSGPAG